MRFQEIVERFPGARKSGHGFAAKCPAHEDGNASLSITEGEDGRTLLKCHAGCEFSQIVAAAHLEEKDLFPSEGRPPIRPAAHTSPSPAGHQAIDWKACVDSITERHVDQLCEWRGYSREIVAELKRRRLIGLWNGKHWAIPNHDAAGNTISAHVRLEKGWQFAPGGQPSMPLVIGSPRAADKVWVFESQWDAFCAMDAALSADRLNDSLAIVCTRGASNGAKLEGIIPSGKRVVAFPQNDPVKPDGTSPALKWLAEVEAVVPGRLLAAATPAEFKDLNDWAKGSKLIGPEFWKAVSAARPTGKAGEQIKELERRRFDATKEPPPLRAVFSLAGVPIATPGNLAAIAAEAKAGKSAVIGALMACAMVPEVSDADCLGFSAADGLQGALLHLDTEQSPDDHHHSIVRALRRAGVEGPPPWLRSYCLTGFTANQCRDMLKLSIDLAKEECGGVRAILIDGVADLVNDPNDPEECNAFVAELHALAISTDAPIIGVLHFNPGGQKTRGHLGSQLERKAETNLVLSKSEDITAIFSTKQRRAPILERNAPKFTWSDEGKMHVSVSEGPRIPRAARAIEPYMDEVFPNGIALKFSDLVSTLMRVTEKSRQTCERYIAEALKCGLISKGFRGSYVKGGCAK